MERDLELEAVPPPDAVTSPEAFAASYEDFEQVEQLGSGGNAAVYRAFGPDGREVALKVPHIEGTLSATVLDEFTSEAETWASIDDHDHVVGIMDWGSEPVPWLAMEYMDGGTLRDRVGEVELEEALWIIAVVARTLRHAHRHGVAHLDIKPENVLFREMPEGQWDVPKVADWGLAKRLIDFEGEQTGLSLSYAAPEQLGSEGADPDNRTDVYQLGAVAYELLTGRPPFEGDEVDVVERIRTESPTPPSELNPDLPPEIDEVLLSALAKDQGDRYEDVLLFRDAIEELLEVRLGERDSTSDLGSAARDSTAGEDTAQQDARTKGPDEQFCRSCGAIVDEDAEVCPECDEETAGHTSSPGPSEPVTSSVSTSSPPAQPTPDIDTGSRTADAEVYRDEAGTASLSAAFAYPRRTDRFGANMLAGSLMVALSFLVVPAIALTGYYVRVLETSIDDREFPPAMTDWGMLTRKGLGGTAILLAFVGVALLGFVFAGAVESQALAWLMLLLFYGMYFVASIGLGAYAQTGAVGDAFDLDLVLEIATEKPYLLAMAKVIALWTAATVVMSVLIATSIGVLLVPLVWVYAMTVAGRIHGTGYAETVEGLEASDREPPVDGETAPPPEREAEPDAPA